jgi:serine/threonine protein kinase
MKLEEKPRAVEYLNMMKDLVESCDDPTNKKLENASFMETWNLARLFEWRIKRLCTEPNKHKPRMIDYENEEYLDKLIMSENVHAKKLMQELQYEKVDDFIYYRFTDKDEDCFPYLLQIMGKYMDSIRPFKKHNEGRKERITGTKEYKEHVKDLVTAKMKYLSCNNRNYQILRTLGYGGTAVVYVVRDLREPELIYAAKKVYLKALPEEVGVNHEADKKTDFYRSLNEAGILMNVEFKHIIKCYRVDFDMKGNPVLMLDIATTDLDKYIWNNKWKLDIRIKCKFICDICIGMWWLHRQLIVHRDMKPSNVLLEYNTGAKPPKYQWGWKEWPNCKVCDLGICEKLSEDKPNWIADNMAGTNMFWAPESRTGDKYDAYMADYFQLGVVIFYVLEKRMPWGSEEEFLNHLDKDGANGSLQEMCLKLISRNTVGRPKLHEIYDLFVQDLPEDYKEAKKDMRPTLEKYNAAKHHYYDYNNMKYPEKINYLKEGESH